jgi:hypothetical protein
MTQKYVRPAIRNLGETLPNAEGNCFASGSVANITPPPSCFTSGIIAQGSICSDGTNHSTGSGCAPTGGIPYNFGCTNGDTDNTLVCSTGTYHS